MIEEGSSVIKDIAGMPKYGTIKRGRVKFRLGSRIHKLLEGKHLSYSVVTVKNGKKYIKRMNTKGK